MRTGRSIYGIQRRTTKENVGIQVRVMIREGSPRSHSGDQGLEFVHIRGQETRDHDREHGKLSHIRRLRPYHGRDEWDDIRGIHTISRGRNARGKDKKKHNEEIVALTKYLIRRKDGAKISPKPEERDIALFLTDFAMMDRFGWTPQQIREEITPREYSLIASTLETLEGIRKSRESKK